MAPIKEIHVAGEDIFLFQEVDLKLHLSHYRIQLLPELLLSKRVQALENKSYFRLLCHCDNFDLEELWVEHPEILAKSRNRWIQLQKKFEHTAGIEEFQSLSFSITNGIGFHQDETDDGLTIKNGFQNEHPSWNDKTKKATSTIGANPECEPSAKNGGNDSEANAAIGSLIESVKSKYGWSTKKGGDNDLKKTLINGQTNSIELSKNLLSNSNAWPTTPTEKWIRRLKCVCGQPLPSSHLNLAPQLMDYERQLLRRMTVDCDLQPYEKACFESSLWIFYTQILLLQQKCDDYLRTCLMLNDLNLLRNPFFRANFTQDSYLQKQLFNYYSKQKITNNSIACLNCNRTFPSETIKWTELLEYVYSNTDAQRFVELLLDSEQYMLQPIPDKLLLRLTKSEILKKYESSLTNSKLNRLKNHLVKNSFQSDSLHNSNCQHWCKKINLQVSKCSICDRLFTMGSQTMVVFKCKHLFHKLCLIEHKQTVKQCYKCKSNS